MEDRLHYQRTTLGLTFFRQEQESETTIGTGSLKLDQAMFFRYRLCSFGKPVPTVSVDSWPAVSE